MFNYVFLLLLCCLWGKQALLDLFYCSLLHIPTRRGLYSVWSYTAGAAEFFLVFWSQCADRSHHTVDVIQLRAATVFFFLVRWERKTSVHFFTSGAGTGGHVSLSHTRFAPPAQNLQSVNTSFILAGAKVAQTETETTKQQREANKHFKWSLCFF